MLAFQNPSNGILEVCFGDTPKLCAYENEKEEEMKRNEKTLKLLHFSVFLNILYITELPGVL